MKKFIKLPLLIFCTIITLYGIFTAPASDEDTLKKELQRNTVALQENDDFDDSADRIAHAAPKEKNSTDTKIPKAKKKSSQITVIGDSVFLGAALEFKKLEKNSVIDAKISRQVCQALDVAKTLKKKGKLGDIVLISLGTNGPFHSKTGEALIDYLGTDKKIFWIDAYSRKEKLPDSINQTIRKLAKKYKNLTVISWSKEGKKHPDWFYQDGTHLNSKGQKGFAKFICKNVSSSYTH